MLGIHPRPQSPRPFLERLHPPSSFSHTRRGMVSFSRPPASATADHATIMSGWAVRFGRSVSAKRCRRCATNAGRCNRSGGIGQLGSDPRWSEERRAALALLSASCWAALRAKSAVKCRAPDFQRLSHSRWAFALLDQQLGVSNLGRT